jgi:hypothetical protein
MNFLKGLREKLNSSTLFVLGLHLSDRHEDSKIKEWIKTNAVQVEYERRKIGQINLHYIYFFDAERNHFGCAYQHQ